MKRYEIHARRQVRGAASDLADVGRMKEVTVVTRNKTGVIAEMEARLATSLAQKYSNSLTISAV